MKISSNGLVLAQFIWAPVSCVGFLLAADWVASFQSQMIGFAYCVALVYVVMAPAIYRAFFWDSLAGAPAASAAAVSAPAAGWQSASTAPIPLTEPVTIYKAVLAHQSAKVVLDRGVGPVAAVHLVNISLTAWVHTEATAKAYADGYNTGQRQLRRALLGTATMKERT